MRSVLRGSLCKIDLIFDMLCDKFTKDYVLKNAVLIDFSDTVGVKKTTCDIVYIGSGGVLLITVISDGGLFNNPEEGDWSHTYSTDGEPQTDIYVNPFQITNSFKTVIDKLLEHENISPSVVGTLVVHTNENANFAHDLPNLISIDNLMKYIKEFNKNGRLRFSKQKNVAEIIYKYSKFAKERLTEIANERNKRAKRSVDLQTNTLN